MTQYAEEWYTNMFGNTLLSEYGNRVKEQELNLGQADFIALFYDGVVVDQGIFFQACQNGIRFVHPIDWVCWFGIVQICIDI